MNYYNDIWFWRASDQAAVARHLRDRSHTTQDSDRMLRPDLIARRRRLLLRTRRAAKA